MPPTSSINQRYEEDKLRISLIEQKQEFIDTQIDEIKEVIKDLPVIIQTLNNLAEQLTEHKELHEKINDKLEVLSIDSVKKGDRVNLLWKALLFIIALGVGYVGNNVITSNSNNSVANEIQK